MKNQQDHQEVLALILARGGSKGIPRKNVRIIAGKPLIAYSIEQALMSEYITRTIVSTDDPEIAEVSRQFGAEVPFIRPAEYAQDMSPDIDAFRHALNWLTEKEGYSPELVVHLRPTGPLRRVDLIDQAIDLLTKHSEADALRSVSSATQTPYKMWRITDDEYLEPLLRIEGVPDCQSLPRQKLPMVYWQNGYVDILRPRTVLEQHSMFGRKVVPFVVHEPIYELDYTDDIPKLEETLQRIQAGLPLNEAPQEQRHPV